MPGGRRFLEIAKQRNFDTPITRRTITAPVGVEIATTAGGIVAPTYVSSGFAFTNGQEFASYAARFSEYRVRQMTCHFIACHPAQVPTATVGADHGVIYLGQIEDQVTAATGSLVLAYYGREVRPTYQSFRKTVTWDRNPNAKLWNPVGAAIPAGNTFGIEYGTQPFATNPLIASTTYFVQVTEFEVEFRGEQ